MAVLLCGNASAQGKISNVFIDTDLRQALQDIALQAGATIIAGSEVSGLVTAELREASLREALDVVLAGTGYEVAKRSNYYLVYSPDPASPSFRDVSRSKLVRLQHVPARVALGLLSEVDRQYVRADDATNSLMITAPYGDLMRILGVIKQMDVEGMELPPDENGLASKLEFEKRLCRLSHLKTDSAMAVLPKHLKEYVTADEKNHLLMVHAPSRVAEEITRTIQEIDVPRRQVLLDARVVVLEHTDLLDLGLEWDFPSAQFGSFTDSDAYPRWPWGFQVGYTPDKSFTNSLMLSLNLLQQNEEATIVATPQVMAQNGSPAELKVATEEYFQITTGGVYERVELEKIETGTLLTILPRIGENGEITLDVSAEVSNVVARFADNLPVVTRRQAKSTVRIQDGGTTAIAGLMDTRTRKQDEGVPGLADIDLFGELFKNRSGTTETKQIAVFVTARIVPDDRNGMRRSPRDDEVIPTIGEELFIPQLKEALLTCPL